MQSRDIHVWPVRVCAPDDIVAEFSKVLTGDELERAARFITHRLRQSFILTRGVLRILLGDYAGIAPADVPIHYGENGKPALPAATGMRFNLSHSGDIAVFGFTRGCELGIDVEQIRPMPNWQDVAHSYFRPEEAALLDHVSPPDRDRAFFLCWTRKEAYVKAIGRGLAAPLDNFAVTVMPHERARLLHIALDRTAAAAWTMHNLDVGAGYVGALAYNDAPRPLDVFPITHPAQVLGRSRRARPNRTS